MDAMLYLRMVDGGSDFRLGLFSRLRRISGMMVMLLNHGGK